MYTNVINDDILRIDTMWVVSNNMNNTHYHHLKAPTEVITTQLGIPQGYKQQCIEEIYRLGDSMGQTTSIKALMSSYHVWNETNVLNSLKDNIVKAINNVKPIHDKEYEYELSNMWTVVYKKDNYANSHYHTPYQTSFIYYLKSTGNTPLVFDDCNFQVNPVDDTLVIFPGYLYHSVPLHQEQSERICVVGNLKWIIKPIG